MELEGRVLAMYDVRGIQRYIYTTSKLKDAMGASVLIDNILTHALTRSCRELKDKMRIRSTEIEWENEKENRPKPYDHEKAKDVQVLYIGGGNAFVSFRDENLCIEINKKMAKYIIEKTYSLQLASVYIPMTENYAIDYKHVFDKMNQVKSNMTITKPLGTLPVMCAELKTGLPVVDQSELLGSKTDRGMSRETYLKWNAKDQNIKEKDIDKILDNYARRGENSLIAVVHIDGNNMGLRIRKLIENITDYQKAVTWMRQISYNIKYSYLRTFEQMRQRFEEMGRDNKLGSEKRFVRKVVVAGDDITYVCNAFIGMETVEWFCQKISQLTMNAGLMGNGHGEISDSDIQEYGFSVCAGIAYIHSHFPFGTAYEVAESCCDEAKNAAKAKENKAYYQVTEAGKYEVISMQRYLAGIESESVKKREQSDGMGSSYPYYFEKTGNFFDFQICKNIQCLDVKRIREKEYITASGERLFIRPYYVPMLSEGDPLNQVNAYDVEGSGLKYNNYEQLKRDIKYFSDTRKIPRSFAKKIRNTYSLGESQIALLAAFLDSRQWKMPDGQKCSSHMYLKDRKNVIARWYDALEIMDYSLLKTEEEETTNEEKEA